jgi:hypothetical protein
MVRVYSAPLWLASITLGDRELSVVAGKLSVPEALWEDAELVLPEYGFEFLGEVESAMVVTGVFEEAGAGEWVQVAPDFNISVWSEDPANPVLGTFTIERSFDGGTTALPRSDIDVAPATGGPFSISASEIEHGVQYRIVCSQLVSGVAHWRISF